MVLCLHYVTLPDNPLVYGSGSDDAFYVMLWLQFAEYAHG